MSPILSIELSIMPQREQPLNFGREHNDRSCGGRALIGRVQSLQATRCADCFTPLNQMHTANVAWSGCTTLKRKEHTTEANIWNYRPLLKLGSTTASIKRKSRPPRPSAKRNLELTRPRFPSELSALLLARH